MTKTKSQVWAEIEQLAEDYRKTNLGAGLTQAKAIERITTPGNGPISAKAVALVAQYRDAPRDLPEAGAAPARQRQERSQHGRVRVRIDELRKSLPHATDEQLFDRAWGELTPAEREQYRAEDDVAQDVSVNESYQKAASRTNDDFFESIRVAREAAADEAAADDVKKTQDTVLIEYPNGLQRRVSRSVAWRMRNSSVKFPELDTAA